MAQALGSLCLGASLLLSPPLNRSLVRGPRAKSCTVGQPLYLVNGSVLVSVYRWSSGTSGSALWYCTISWGHCSVRWASLHYCHHSLVAFPGISRDWVYLSCLLPPVSSRRIVTAQPVLFVLATPHPPPGPCSSQIRPFSVLWPLAQWFELLVGVTDLVPLRFQGNALRLVQFQWVHDLAIRSPDPN